MLSLYRFSLNAIILIAGIIILLPPITMVAQDSPRTDCLILDGTTEHDFGDIEQSDTVEHTFVFKNNCAETVEISSARASCGCTATVLSESVMAPGKKAEINVRFTPPKGTRGKVTKTVSVYLKDRQEPHTILRVAANVKSDIDIQPASIQLSDMKKGDKVKTDVTITNVSDKRIKINTTVVNLTSYRDTDGSGKMQAVPMQGGKVTPEVFELAPKQSQKLTLTFKAQHEGQINGSVGLMLGENLNTVYLYGVVGPAKKKK
jgi:hypothetical protein